MTNPAPRPRALLFDLDGTLLDTVELILFSYRHTLAAHCGAAPPDERFRGHLGTPLREVLAQFASHPEEVDAMIDTYRRHNEDHHDAMVTTYAGIPEILAAARAAALPMAVITNKSRAAVLRGLEVCGLAEHFSIVITIDDVPRPKPHPDGLLDALAHLSCAPGDAIYVGDSPHDMTAGRAAGVRTAAATWGPFSREALAAERPDIWLESPAALAAWIDR